MSQASALEPEKVSFPSLSPRTQKYLGHIGSHLFLGSNADAWDIHSSKNYHHTLLDNAICNLFGDLSQ